MRIANSAILREHYPIPTIEEMTWGVNVSTVIIHLDFNLAYHQIELPSESTAIIFQTHKSKFQYARLVSGANCVPEMYQKIITWVFKKCQGVLNFFGNTTAHGKGEETRNTNM
jgi:hypothetical protein